MSRTVKVLTVFGTRPEAIKMAPVIEALAAEPGFDNVVCVTSQHREMLTQTLGFFDIVPDHDLDIMKPGQDLYDVTINALAGLKPVLEATRPDVTLVHGDTTTTLAATLASFYAGAPVGHVEAGLRTGNFQAPFPEEANRALTDRLCAFLFAPTHLSRENLLRENTPPANIWVTGNTIIDAILMARDKVMGRKEKFYEYFNAGGLDVDARPLVLITAHRRESFGEGFENICRAILDLTERFPGVNFVYPAHLNPNVRGPVERHLAPRSQRQTRGANLYILDPLDYPAFVFLMNRSRLILTDSGGIQEEAPSLGKPVLVMRETTERPEGIEAGTVRLVGANRELIVSGVSELLTDPRAYDTMSRAHNPYGDGKAAGRIVAALKERLS